MSVAETIRRRRAIFPVNYVANKPIKREILEQILESANWAPTHRLTEPWRFQVFHSPDSRARLGDFMAEDYQRATLPEFFSEEKFMKMQDNPRRSGAVIAIILQRDPQERVPEFEEIAAVAMAVENMWLHCSELGLGCYWSTPRLMLEPNAFLALQSGQRCLGLFYIGYHNAADRPGKRGPVAEKTIWH